MNRILRLILVLKEYISEKKITTLFLFLERTKQENSLLHEKPYLHLILIIKVHLDF